MAVASLIISCLSLLLGGFSFWLYDRKIKKQDAIINEYRIKQFETKQEEEKKAVIRANIIKEEKGKRTMKIYNSGKAVAYNIRIKFQSDMNEIVYDDKLFPYEKLMPQDCTSLSLLRICTGASNKINVKFIWDDDFQKDNYNTQVLTLA